MRTCRFCAEEIQDAAVVCKHCGRDVPVPIAASPARPMPVLLRRVLWTAGSLVVGLYAAAVLIPLAIELTRTPAERAKAAETQAFLDRIPDQPSAFDEKDWHPAGPEFQVRWINDDAFSHVGGHCYGRKTDGSTRTADGKPGYAPLGEKFCIRFGAKDTPFDVPDQR